MKNNFSSRETILINRLKKGDSKAFEELFFKYKNKLFSFCFRFTKCEEQAEEIVNDVLLKIWTDKHKIDPSLSFSSFLYKISSNLCINYLKKVASDSNLKRKVYQYLNFSHNDTEESVIYSDLQTQTQMIIDRLPPQRKLIYQLSREQYLSHDEIARKLGISKNTVKNQMIMALKQIKYFLHANAELILLICFFLTKKFPDLITFLTTAGKASV